MIKERCLSILIKKCLFKQSKEIMSVDYLVNNIDLIMNGSFICKYHKNVI